MKSNNKNVVIISAVRTAIGAFDASLKHIQSHDLGSIVIKEVLKKSKLKSKDVDEVIMGQVLTAAVGQNPARQAAIKAGIPINKTAYVVNQVCGSGLRSVAMGYQAIRTNDASVIVAGGQESMSNAPHAINIRKNKKLEKSKLVDTMIKDGLWDAFNGYHMGTTAENIATKWQITRKDQDEFALSSQTKTEKAQKDGKFNNEIVLGADSVIDINRELVSKPKNREEALKILKKLNGKTHHLISSICISKNGSMIWNYTDKAALTMKNMTDKELKEYLFKIKDEALYSYNVYQIEGEGRSLFSKIEGDENTIMGLPVKKIKEYLRNLE